MRDFFRHVTKHAAKHRVIYIYALIATTIMGPLLSPGYVLTLDMVWLPEIDLPHTATNTILLYAVLGAFDFFLPSDIVQKLVLLAILWAAGYGVHRLVTYVHRRLFQRDIHIVAALAAGVLATINPFTYARFMDGHWKVLIGYALLPWITWRLLVLLSNPTIKKRFDLDRDTYRVYHGRLYSHVPHGCDGHTSRTARFPALSP